MLKKSLFTLLGLLLLSTPKPNLSAAQSQLGADLKFHSQAHQDRFVHAVLYGLLNKQDRGYYLEVGAGDPIQINNSFLFEKKFSWKGVSLDINTGLCPRWKQHRSNPLYIVDATQADYRAILKDFPATLDYLSLDIDGAYDTVLRQIPFDTYHFKIITIEHDAYRYGDRFRQAEREFLEEQGYYLLGANVKCSGYVFEDWWIYPEAFPDDVLAQLRSLNFQAEESATIVKVIESLRGTSRIP